MKNLILILLLNFVSCTTINIEGNPQTCYLGMSLPNTYPIFTTDSPWNTLIPSNVELYSYSESIINKLKTVTLVRSNISLWTAPMHVMDSRYCPKKNVYAINTDKIFYKSVDPLHKGVVSVPMPTQAWQDPTEDAHMILVDKYKRQVWELGGHTKKRSNGDWESLVLDVWSLDGKGNRPPFVDYWWLSGVRAGGVPFLGGLIRPEEIEAGIIKHALSISTPINLLAETGNGSWGLWQVCSPIASNTDGTNVGTEYIPMGARIQLDPNLDLNTLNLTPATKTIAKALQNYGAYVVDSGPEFILYFQNLGKSPNKWDKYLNDLNNLSNIPISKMRVLKCNKQILNLK